MTKTFSILLVLGLAISMSVSCSEDIPDCPSKMCLVAGGWQLTSVNIDDAAYDGDLSQYRLNLHMPSPTTATTSDFTRIQASGNTDKGTWSLENNGSILRLDPEGTAPTEDWIIETLTPRTMVLIINRDVGIKGGPGKIEFVLEPF